MLHSEGKLAESEQTIREALALQMKAGVTDSTTARLSNLLADLLESQGDYAGVELLYRRALEAQKKALGNEHLEVACALDRLASVLIKQPGKEQEAEGLLRESLAMHRKMGGLDHPHVPIVLTSLASVLRSEGKLAESEQTIREALALQMKAGVTDSMTGQVEQPPGRPALSQKGDYAGAELLYRQALEAQKKALGNEHLEVACALDCLGQRVEQAIGQGARGRGAAPQFAGHASQDGRA